MKRLTMIVVLALGVVLGFNANAEGGKERPEPPSFSEIDSNTDLLISREEMEAAMSARMGDRGPRRGRGGDPEERFNRLDSDGDGYLNEAEFEAARAKFEERRGHHRRRGDCDEESSET